MHGFQLWANLPAALKMTDPRYQDIPSSAIPEVTEDDGTKARIICGEFWGKRGPVEGVADRSMSVDARYVDISVPPGKRKRIQVETTRNAFAYVFAGAGTFRDASNPQAVLTESAVDPNAAPVYDAKNHSLVLFDRGDEIVVQAGPEGIRFLLVSGKPLEEPVAWYGPIVMNTQAELRQAMSELQHGNVYQARVMRFDTFNRSQQAIACRAERDWSEQDGPGKAPALFCACSPYASALNCQPQARSMRDRQ